MSQVVELGRLVWNKAGLTVNGVGPERQVRFWGDGTTFNVTDPTVDAPIDSLTIRVDPQGFRTAERLDAKTFELVGEDGTVWKIRSIGCGCGGG